MKPVRTIVPAALLLLSLLCAPRHADAAARETKFERLLNPRTVTCWVEGVAMDELVIGARAKVVFVCMDRRLGSEILRLRPEGAQAAEYESVPAWLRASVGDYMKRNGRTLFAVHVTAIKPWEFDFTSIRVGDYRPQREDILLDDRLRQIVPTGETAVSLPSDFAGQFGFYVPSDLLKPGSEIRIGYDESLATWVVPKN